MRADELLRELESAVSAAGPEQLRSLIVALATVTAHAAARQLELATRPPAPAKSEDRMLTAKEVAAMANVSVRWVYDHSHELPFAKRLGGEVVRFSERGLRQWIESRKA